MLDFKCAGCGMTRDNARSAGAYRPDVFGEIFVLCTICEYSIAKHYIVRTANVATLVAAKRAARKAAKNLVMFKTVRRRPWTDNKGVLYSSKAGVERMAQNGDDALSTAQQYKDGPKLYLHSKLRHLREPSGFVSMSRVAEEMRLTKAHAPDFVDEAVTYTEEQLKAIETWIRETWGDLKPDEIAEKLGRGEL